MKFFQSTLFQECTIPLAEVQKVETSISLGFIQNGLTIMANDAVHKFVVESYDRGKWVQAISGSL
ncbi:MAG: hypothetical protein FWD99_00790 [Oscillospiraceae bacterium]|nr:hypothetical protein [Oscillospiraceae bacterium]